MIKARKEDNWMPYALRYKEEKVDNKALFITTSILCGGYLLFIGIIGMKLGL